MEWNRTAWLRDLPAHSLQPGEASWLVKRHSKALKGTHSSSWEDSFSTGLQNGERRLSENSVCYSAIKSLSWVPNPISTVQRRPNEAAQEPRSKASIVAVHPLCKASLHQRPVYQYHLISYHTPELNQRQACCTVACHLGQQCCIACHLTHGCICLR